jgi:hypothetical protein
MALNLPLDANRPNVRVGSISGVVTVLHDVRYPDERTSPSASVRSEKCRFRTHAPQTKTYSITSIGACVSSDCGTDGQQRCIDYSHRAGAYSAWRRPNVQLRRQTDQQRRNGWHEPAGHDRTMQLFMAFA